MLAIAFAADLLQDPDSLAVRRELAALGVPIAADAESLGLPPFCIWYITRGEEDALAARIAGRNVVLVDPRRTSIETDPRGIHRVARAEDVLSVLSGPYTQAALELRYLFRTVLG